MTPDLDWANPGSSTRIGLQDQIKSTRFTTTGNPLYEGQIAVAGSAGNENVTREVWISTCPGTPYSEALDSCKRTGTSTTVVRWHQNQDDRFCALNLNAEYYINMRNVNCEDRMTGNACDVYRIIYHNGSP